MNRFLCCCVLLLAALAIAPAAGAMLVDPVAVSAQGCTHRGDGGADRLTGTARRDVICGLGGADRLRGERGDDVLLGGAGRDLLEGMAGSDLLSGGSGNDRAFGGAGADDLLGGAGNDGLGGGLGPDDLSGGLGRDVVHYGERRARVLVSVGSRANDGVVGERDNVRGDVEDVRGGRGSDVITGTGAANRLFGGTGSDRLRGRGGSDVLSGGAGDDRVDAREGAAGAQAGAVDRVVCGAGTDTALVEPVDVVDADCENVVGGGAGPPVQGPPVQGPPVQGPPAVNRAPTAIALSNDSVAENEPAGTAVGVLSAADPDAGDSHSFALVSGAGADDNGSFVIVSDELRTAARFDYETRSSYSVRIRASDFGTPAGVVERAFTIAVTDANEPPTAVDDMATVVEDAAATAVDVLANDTDSDGGMMAIVSVSDAADGTVVVTGGGTGLTYRPDADFCGFDGFSYSLNGGSMATVSVAVTCVDDLPVAVADSATVPEDSAATPVDVLANDTDVEGDARTILSVTQPANGTVALTGGLPGAHTGLTYAPDAGYCNSEAGTPDTFSYTLTGGSTATVSVTVSCGDDAPTAVADSATVAEDAPATAVDVLANDTDSDGGPKTIASASDPANGTVAVTGGGTGLTYQPDTNFCGSDSFTYTLNGGSTATVSVTVSCVDDPPTAVADSATVLEDSAATAITVLVNDTDTDSGPRSIASVTQPANGAVVITGAGTGLTYQPDPNFCSLTADTFTYTLAGGSTATVSVTVTCVDDPPTAVADSASVVEDAAASAVEVLANDTDPDGGAKTIASASDPANGTVVVTGGGTGLTYQPDANFCGSDTFTYTLAGGSTATVSVTVACVDDPPTAVNDTATVAEDASATAINVLANDANADGGPLSIASVAQPTNGSVVITGNGTGLTYQPAANFCSATPDAFTYTLNGGSTATVAVTVTCVDDPPTAVNDSATVLEDAAATAIAVLANDTDIDAGPRSIASVTQPANGTVAITGGGSGLTYLPNANFCNSPPGTTASTFTYTLNGGSSATVSVTVTCVNDAPVADDETFDGANGAIGNTSLVVNDPDDGAPALTSPKKSISGDILAGDTDIDGPGPLTVTAGTFTTNDGGTVTIEADGDFIYINDPADNCTDTSDFFDYTVSDGNAAGPGPAPGTDTGRVTIAVAGCVWYVSNNATGNSGTSTAPFDTLVQAETASAANHTVFVFDGDNTATGYGGDGYALNAGERLIGEHEGLTVDPDQGGPLTAQALHPANPGAHPTLTATGADVVALDDANEVRGVSLDPSGAGGGIAGASGDVSGTIDDVNITDTGTLGTQPGLELDTTTGTFALTNLTVNTNTAIGVRLNNAGTVDFGTTSITTAGARALDAASTSAATPTNLSTSTFDAITVTGSAAGAVRMSGTTGTTVFGDGVGTDLALTTTSGTAAAIELANAGTITVAAAGTDNVNATGGPAIDVTGTAGATLEFDTVSSTNSTTDAINLAGLAAGTFTATGGTIGGAAGIAFDLDGGNGTITYPGTINDGTGQSVDITNRSGGTTTLSGAITDGTDAGGGISLSANSGGSTTFSGTTKTLNTGASAAFSSTGTGHTINFTGGGLDIDTTTGAGLSATGGGTINVTTGTNPNTIDSATGTALNVADTTIGASGLTFRSVASNGGGAAGIVLSNTGSSGGLVVAGNGGTCTSAVTCTGGAIVNKTSAGISLSNTRGISLTRMLLDNNDGSGVLGSGVIGFAIANSVVTNNDDGLSEGVEAGLRFTNLHGASSISATTFQGQTEDHVRITNNTTGSPNLNLSVTGSTFNINSATTGGHGVALLGTNTANMTLSVTGSTFDDILSSSVIMNLADTAAGNLTVTGNQFRDIGVATTMGTSASADLTFNITNNTEILRAVSNFIQLVAGSTSTNASQIRGTISGNVIGNSTAGSGHVGEPLPVQYGIAIDLRGDQDSVLNISGNTTNHTEWEGIWYSAADFGTNAAQSPTTDLILRDNNVVSIDDNSAFPRFDIRGVLVDFRHTTNGCLDIAGNSSVGSPGFEHLRVRQRDTSVVRLERFSDGDATPNELINNVATVESFLVAQNDPGSTADATLATGFTEAADNTCRTP